MIGPMLGLVALGLHLFAPSGWVERIYGQRIFVGIRVLLDTVLGWIPIPITYLFIFILLILVLRSIRRGYKSGIGKSKTWMKWIKNLSIWFGWIIFFFYFLWGLNYDRPPVSYRLPFEIEPIQETSFLDECRLQASTLNDLRNQFNRAIDQAVDSYPQQRIVDKILEDAIELGNQFGYSILGKPQIRYLKPSGILLRIATAGFYNPFSGECNIDNGLHEIQKPFVTAHEIFHGLGVTGEGDCNFLAYIICHQSEDPFIRYSGELGYWRYLAGPLRRTDRELSDALWEQMDPKVLDDFKEIRNRLNRYPDIAPRLRKAFYTTYLKTNKISDGLANYNNIVKMVINWRKAER